MHRTGVLRHAVRVGLHHFPAEAPAESALSALAADGAVVLDDVVEPSALGNLLRELGPHIDAAPVGTDHFAGRRTRRIGGLVARSRTCRALVQHPQILDIVRSVLDRFTTVQLHLTQLIGIQPGETSQRLHRDQWAFDLYPFPPGCEVQCNTMWAITDFTADNGATRAVLGSHLDEGNPKYRPSDAVVAEMARGSVLVYTGSILHGGGANRSSAVRYGMNIGYSAGWLRQEENQYLSTPQEVARTFSDDLLRLLGYARGAYALGYVDDTRDPLDVLRGASTKHGFAPDT